MSDGFLTYPEHLARLSDEELIRKAQPQVSLGIDALTNELAERLRRAIGYNERNYYRER